MVLSPKELDELNLSNEEKEELVNIIKEYSKTHKLDKVNYTDSMVKIFLRKMQLQALEKIKKRGVPQKLLQKLNESSIDDLSFLEEEEKLSLPKILEEYSDNRAFRELNTLIERQTSVKVARKNK